MTITSVLYSFLPTLIIFFTACISPGPNTVLSISTALTNTKTNLAFMCLGLAFGGFVWSFLSLLGVNTLMAKFPVLIQIIATVGGLYLIHIGIRATSSVLKAIGQTNPLQTAGSSKLFTSRLHAFQTGLTTTLTNPKVTLLWITLSPMIPIKPDELLVLFFYATIIGTIVFSIYFSIGLLFTGRGATNFYSKNTVTFDCVFAVLFILLGLYFLITYSLFSTLL